MSMCSVFMIGVLWCRRIVAEMSRACHLFARVICDVSFCATVMVCNEDSNDRRADKRSGCDLFPVTSGMLAPRATTGARNIGRFMSIGPTRSINVEHEKREFFAFLGFAANNNASRVSVLALLRQPAESTLAEESKKWQANTQAAWIGGPNA